jgi:hypothetical protein
MGLETQTGGPGEEEPEAPREGSDVERVESGEQSETGSMPEEVERAGEREAEAAEG